MANPNISQPRYALILNGTEFIFLKLSSTSENKPLQYATTDLLTLKHHENDLYIVLATLKKIRDLVIIQ
jgi:hypothetical protein